MRQTALAQLELIQSARRLPGAAPCRREPMAQPGFVDDRGADLFCFGDNRLGIVEMGEPAIPIDDPAVHEHRAYVAALPRRDEARQGSMQNADVRLLQI